MAPLRAYARFLLTGSSVNLWFLSQRFSEMHTETPQEPVADCSVQLTTLASLLGQRFYSSLESPWPAQEGLMYSLGPDSHPVTIPWVGI